MVASLRLCLFFARVVGAMGRDEEHLHMAVAPDGADARLFRASSEHTATTADKSLLRTERQNSKPMALEVEGRAAIFLRHVQGVPADAKAIGTSVNSGIKSLDRAIQFFKDKRVDEGLRALGMDLLHIIEPWVKEALDDGMHQAFRTKWADHVVGFKNHKEGPKIVKALHKFKDDGDSSSLIEGVVKALGTISVEICSELPEDLARELSNYVSAVADSLSALGGAWALFENGHVVDAVEALWKNIGSAVDPMLPHDLRTAESYEMVMVSMDKTLMTLTDAVEEFAKEMAEDACCWKDYVARERSRPDRCPSNHKYDGKYFCFMDFDGKTCEGSTAEGHSCKERIEHQKTTYGLSARKAANLVALQFPENCMVCAEEAAKAAGDEEDVADDTSDASGGDDPEAITETTSSGDGLMQQAFQTCDGTHAGDGTCADHIRTKHDADPAKTSRELINEVVDTDKNTECEACRNKWLLLERSGVVTLDDSLQHKFNLENESKKEEEGEGNEKEHEVDGTLWGKAKKVKAEVRGKSDRVSEPAECDESTEYKTLQDNWCYADCPEKMVESDGIMCKTKCHETEHFQVEGGTGMCGTTAGAVHLCENNMVMNTQGKVLTSGYVYSELEKRGISDANSHVPMTVEKFVNLGEPYEHKRCHEAHFSVKKDEKESVEEKKSVEDDVKKAESAVNDEENPQTYDQ